ncbi:MAG: hypothetical protein K2G55_09205 [Lachnospiraceae bacterium]|nr:hypothetical protein [Lachnospiraceae bacterium]MDE7202161.1 hypothetical protein [Lachnospiraceae bacterium]
MKKHTANLILASALSTGLLLTGCKNTASPELPEQNTIESSMPEFSNENAAETARSEPTAESPADSTDTSVETSENTVVSQGGPYGKISLSIPDGWRYETCPMDSGLTVYGLYGIRFYPEDASSGYITLNYIDSFGVCGTGLATEQATIAGNPASIGTYDNNQYWDYISFRDDYDGIVAMTYYVEGWWETYSDQVMDILDTLSFDSTVKEGGAYIYDSAYDLDQIGLSFTLKNISSTGATLVFRNYDIDAPTGELTYSDDFLLEMQKDDVWEEAPIVLEGNYGFNEPAYMIPTEGTSEQELNWEWLYGTLAPGTYRIKKSVLDFRKTGDFDKYTVCAQFILN